MRLFACVLAVVASVNAVAAPDRVLYELGEKCGKQASAEFKREWGNGIDSKKDSVQLATFRNHYNPRLNACLYLIESTATSREKSGQMGPAFHSVSLYDMNENHELATFTSQDGNPRLLICTLYGKRCESREQFDAAVNALMTE